MCGMEEPATHSGRPSRAGHAQMSVSRVGHGLSRTGHGSSGPRWTGHGRGGEERGRCGRHGGGAGRSWWPAQRRARDLGRRGDRRDGWHRISGKRQSFGQWARGERFSR
jgi:hypothetical protein